MISLETSRKLKCLGLQWEPKIGDWYSYQGCEPELLTYQPQLKKKKLLQEDSVWLPRLNQLLEELDKRGWDWFISKRQISRYKYIVELVIKDSNNNIINHFLGKNPEEAVAKALKWDFIKQNFQ